MFKFDFNKSNGEQFFYKILFAVFVIRLAFAIWIPMTGDEAYFITWGKNLDYGYYDHTPFVGWLLAVFLTISDATWWLRLPAILLPLVLAVGIFKILKPRFLDNPQIALWVALTFLVAPVNIINVFITTDTPLILFSFISAWFFYKAIYENEENNSSAINFILCGLFLGLAFFSKYFAIFLGIAYGLYIIFFYRNRKGFIGLPFLRISKCK